MTCAKASTRHRLVLPRYCYCRQHFPLRESYQTQKETHGAKLSGFTYDPEPAAAGMRPDLTGIFMRERQFQRSSAVTFATRLTTRSRKAWA
jgi:hypothetical protein